MGGDVQLDEAERAVGHDLPRGDYETVAGLLIAHHGTLPRAGDTVDVELPSDPADLVRLAPVTRRVVVDVLSVERHVPRLVRVRLVESTQGRQTVGGPDRDLTVDHGEETR